MKNYKINISRFAELDLEEIIEFYLDINPTYIETLISKFEKKINTLKNFPKIGKIVPELEKQNILQYRELIEGNYRIIYEIKAEQIFVHTIIDARRNFEELIIRKLTRR